MNRYHPNFRKILFSTWNDIVSKSVDEAISKILYQIMYNYDLTPNLFRNAVKNETAFRSIFQLLPVTFRYVWAEISVKSEEQCHQTGEDEVTGRIRGIDWNNERWCGCG